MVSRAVTYEFLARHINRAFTGGEVYATGTVAISSGVVTLTNGVFPAWAARGTINSAGTFYTVNTRDSTTQVTLDDTTSAANVGSGAAYCLIEAEEYESRSMDDAIISGLSDFYVPTPSIEGEQPHTWSFLTPTASLSLTEDNYDIDLTSDFGQVAGDFTYQDGADQRPISLVSEPALRGLRAGDSASGPPEYVCIRQKAFVATTDEVFEALFYPTPDQSYTVDYSYFVVPNHLDPTNDFPYGGVVHGDTILQACMAAAERRFDDSQGGHEQKFQQRLAASIQLDMKARSVTTEVYSHVEPAVGSYDWLRQEVGVIMGYGGNPGVLTHPESRRVREIIRRGIVQFNMPPSAAIGGSAATHVWSFLRPTTTLSTVVPYSASTITVVGGVVTLASGTFPPWSIKGDIDFGGTTYRVSSRDSDTQLTLVDKSATAAAGTAYKLGQFSYDLPSDFAGLDGKFTFRPGDNLYYQPFGLYPEERIRTLRQSWDSYDHPRAAAIRPVAQNESTGTRHVVQFYPTPNAIYHLTYKYKARPRDVSEGEFPHGGLEHAETMLASCLAIAEGGAGPARQNFTELLAASLQMDHREFTPDRLGPMLENSDETGQLGYHAYHEVQSNVAFGSTEYN